jgi:GTP-binding protein|tara:strand:- start:3658 stop:4284 length:627 start_codon:yes stop_codon:yes gene_type:complete
MSSQEITGTLKTIPMKFDQTCFQTSAATLEDCPADSSAEVAFAGRSNAGKSSAVNVITSLPQLARTSKTPGRTQLINFFFIEEGKYLVDLPGYGYAKVPLERRDKWQFELEKYLRRRKALVGLILLSDIRHPLKKFDRMMIEWAAQANLPLHLLLTKADKLKRGATQKTLLKVEKELTVFDNVSVQLFSALRNIGVDPVRKVLTQWLA